MPDKSNEDLPSKKDKPIEKLLLDVTAMEDDFFAGAHFLGLGTHLPGYRICWLLNRTLNWDFVRVPHMDITFKNKKNQPFYFFDIYEHKEELSEKRTTLYNLKSYEKLLLPELKNLDYLCMFHEYPSNEFDTILKLIASLPEIQLVANISVDNLKSKNNLLL